MVVLFDPEVIAKVEHDFTLADDISVAVFVCS